MCDENCPCCSGELYQNCCQPLLSGAQKAKSPEALMRSRYSAFCLSEVTYLIDTLHPDYRKADDRQSILENCRSTNWLGLRVIEHWSDKVRGVVEFSAFFLSDGIQQLHERSNFIYEDGTWYYTNGDLLPPVKLSRNDSCFCGSGKKFKRCHDR